jgi:hypothetical protein
MGYIITESGKIRFVSVTAIPVGNKNNRIAKSESVFSPGQNLA